MLIEQIDRGFPPSGEREGEFSNLLSSISVPGVQGYSYSFDANTGNLTSRTNSLRTKTDTFGYDTEKLDRLTSVTGSASPTVSVTYTTDKSGNIQTKSDAGTYVYDATQPYAVDQITNGLNIATASQTITYYSFEKVKDITEGTKKAEFIYNADQQRIRMVLKTNETTTRTKYYFGGSCEREVTGGVTTQYIWIGGDAYTAVAVAKKVGTGSWTVYNIFRDHLGTITHLKTGSTTDEYSFDAWGRRRDKDDWTYTLTSEPALFADRGFTGHEYLEDFKLYNMNGRLYDPVVGRFLSPDPVVQDPSFTQNLNRYSYCLNNPLKYNDPSGEFWNWPIIWAGNWLIGGLDRWINGKESFKQAFSPTKNPVILSTNYSPSTNQFSHPQIDAFKAAKQEEKIAQQMDVFVASQSGAGSENNFNVKAINNYGGVKGLTVYNYYINQDYPGQAVIDISYTSPYTKGANWTQWLTIKSNGTSRSDWDNGSWGEFGNRRNNSIYYYTDSEIKSYTAGNVISFHDNPVMGNGNFSFEAKLSLKVPREGDILILTWGYRNRSDSPYPLTLYPLKVLYNKY